MGAVVVWRGTEILRGAPAGYTELESKLYVIQRDRSDESKRGVKPSGQRELGSPAATSPRRSDHMCSRAGAIYTCPPVYCLLSLLRLRSLRLCWLASTSGKWEHRRGALQQIVTPAQLHLHSTVL